jgi:hypothetical protein
VAQTCAPLRAHMPIYVQAKLLHQQIITYQSRVVNVHSVTQNGKGTYSNQRAASSEVTAPDAESRIPTSRRPLVACSSLLFSESRTATTLKNCASTPAMNVDAKPRVRKPGCTGELKLHTCHREFVNEPWVVIWIDKSRH